ncbi:MATE family efflux transporter [Candidatus Borreliella tachyglossi]|uniref:MATE family efflux transporter n=1 Tax=Candidatus Borreliella tachyglossi TaxID=1964448 RepID=A0A2S1LXE4_9SPIR|nr:MATE family efflux transporter [Candidatus Borreliella tachyglossi]AWG42950.1 MATE family efflux transporter [Candidatus Borreliella tachyglossi]
MYSLSESRKSRVYRDLLNIAIPTAVEFFLFNVIAFTDNIMVSYLGDYPVAGVSLANKFFELFITIAFAVMGAYNILATRQYAKGDIDDFKNTFFISILILLLFSFLFIFISLFYPYFFLGLLSNDSKAISYGITYLDIAVYSFVFAVVKGIIANSLKIVKITKIQVVTSVVAVVLNVVFNYLFIFIFGMGVLGAAIATTLVRGIELVFYLLYTVFNSDSHFHLKVKNLKINPVIFSQLIKFFIPIFLNEFIWFLGYFGLIAIFARINTAKYAAYSITFSTYFMGFNIINAFCFSVNIIMGHEMHNDKREIMAVAIYLGKIGFILAIVTSFIMVALSFIAPYVFYELEYASLIGVMLRYYAISVFFTALAFQYLFGFFRAGASPSFGAIMEGSVTFIYTIPIAYLLANYTQIPFELIVFIPTLEDVIKLGISLPYFYSTKWIKSIKTG